MKYQDYETAKHEAQDAARTKLKELLKDHTQKELASRFGITASFLSMVLGGKRDLSDELLKKILG